MIPNGTFPHQFARLGAGTERYEVEHHHCGGNEGAGQVQIRADRRPRRRCNPPRPGWGFCCIRALPRFTATTDLAATLSPSTDFLVVASYTA